MKLPHIQFYTRDWLADRSLRLCSPAARGLWIDMLCLMADCDPYGHLVHNNQAMTIEQIAGLTLTDKGTVKGLIDELEINNVFSRVDESGVIYCRRMVNWKNKIDKCTTAGKKGGNPALKKEELQDHNPETIIHNPIRLTVGVNPTLKGQEDLRITPDEMKKKLMGSAYTDAQVEAYCNAHNGVGWIDGAHRPIKCYRSHFAHWLANKAQYSKPEQQKMTAKERLQRAKEANKAYENQNN